MSDKEILEFFETAMFLVGSTVAIGSMIIFLLDGF